ncbi:unnamed protein product, partial [Prorocentrum cordatum]
AVEEPQPEPPEEPPIAPQKALNARFARARLQLRAASRAHGPDREGAGLSLHTPGPCGFAGARAATEGEDTTQARRDGVEPSAYEFSMMMLACTRDGCAGTALKLFNTILEQGADSDYNVKNLRFATRSRFFTLVAEHLDDERLRKDGLQVLEAVRAHGIPPPLALQDRLVCAWGSRLPEQVLSYFARMQEQGLTLSSAMRQCTAADATASTSEGGTTCHSSTDSTIGQDDAAGDVEETSAEEEPRDPRTAAERTPLRREASTSVPTATEGQCRMPPAAPAWCRLDAPGQCAQLPQIAAQRVGGQRDECTTVMLRNLPCPFLREDLIKVMDAKGFAGSYDFVHIGFPYLSGQGIRDRQPDFRRGDAAL